MSSSVKYDIFQMTQQSLWNDQSFATFKFTIQGYDIDEKVNMIKSNLNSNWIFYLVTDAYLCQQTNWTEWSNCDAIPVGIGDSYRSHINVHGLPGQQLSCNEIKQHKKCVVNLDKIVKFSKTEINIQEGDDGETIKVRLYHELSNTQTRNRSTMTMDELKRLKGYDVIIYFEIPRFYQKEIVIDPMFIGWHKDKLCDIQHVRKFSDYSWAMHRKHFTYKYSIFRWDLVEQIKITALDDFNIDSLMQTVKVSVNIYSVDRDYNQLILNPLTVIIEDNEKCRYCGIGNIQPFNPAPKPPFWDFKSILIMIAFLIILLLLLWSGYKWFKSKYGINNDQYKKLKEDGLITETETNTETQTDDTSITASN